MAYVVKKPLNIAGRRREIGEVLGADEVRSASVIRSGLVAYIPDDSSAAVQEAREGEIHINAPIVSKSGTEVISVSAAAICDALLLMQMPQAEAIAAIGTATDESMLRIVSVCTGNNKIKAAIKERTAELETEDDSEGGE